MKMSLDVEEAEKALWVGSGTVGGGSALFKDPEQFRRKFRAWMWPHDFEVKYIEVWPDYSWAAIGLENPGAVTVLLEHSREHPFKPETAPGIIGRPWEISRYTTASKRDQTVFQNLLKTNEALKKSTKPKVVDNIIKAREEATKVVDSGTSPTPPKEQPKKIRHKSGSGGTHLSRSRPSSRPLEELLSKESRSLASSPGFGASTPEKKKKKKKKHHR